MTDKELYAAFINGNVVDFTVDSMQGIVLRDCYIHSVIIYLDKNKEPYLSARILDKNKNAIYDVPSRNVLYVPLIERVARERERLKRRAENARHL